MEEIRLGVVEGQFADIIWNNEPLSSGKLVHICESELGWKKSTTYTVLKKLCEKGLFKNDNGTVFSLISKDEFNSLKSEKIVDDTFHGSLPAFVAAFTKKRKLSNSEIKELKAMIDNLGGE